MKPRSILVVCMIMIMLFACQAVALNIPTDGLVAYYSFDDGTAMDESGNGYDGTINGATVAEGISGSALHFDGIDDIVVLSSLFSDLNPSQVTLMAFVNLSERSNDNFIATGDPDTTIAQEPDGRVGVNVRLTDTWYGANSSSLVNLNEWALVTGTINRTTQELKIYINGTLEGTKTIPATSYKHPALTPIIGAHPYGGYHFLTKGDIDEVMVYNRTFTADEIANIYDLYTNSPPVNQPPSVGDDIYTMDQDTILSVPVVGVLENDNDSEGDPLTASLVSSPINGDLQLNPDGSFTYTPLPDWYGNVTFTYKANDGIADSNDARVWITVNKTPVPTQYVINATNSTGGTISPSGEIPVSSGGSQVFNLLADKKYKPASITIDDITIDLKNLVVTFNNVFSDHTISAEFTSPSNKPTK